MLIIVCYNPRSSYTLFTLVYQKLGQTHRHPPKQFSHEDGGRKSWQVKTKKAIEEEGKPEEVAMATHMATKQQFAVFVQLVETWKEQLVEFLPHARFVKSVSDVHASYHSSTTTVSGFADRTARYGIKNHDKSHQKSSHPGPPHMELPKLSKNSLPDGVSWPETRTRHQRHVRLLHSKITEVLKGIL